MQFSIEKRDGPARIGELLLQDKKVITPNILFINTLRFKAPGFADILITNNNKVTKKPTIRISTRMLPSLTDKLEGELSVNNYLIYPKDLPKKLHLGSIEYNKNKSINCCIIPAKKEVIDDTLKDNKATLFIVSNIVQLFSQQSKFVEFIKKLREKIGYQRMIYLPCVGDPSCFSLLAYMGVDLFDSMSAIMAARKDVLLFPNGRYKRNELEEIPCSCPTCRNRNVSDLSYSQILDHNYYALLNEIKHVRNAISSGSLRELVEMRIRADPMLIAILRILDYNHYGFLEERTPLTGRNRLLANYRESLYRPEIKRFQKRIIERYKRPKNVKILLLLPCSAKKPYSFSKSHKLFREKIKRLENPYIIHEIIITSPLGIVPRELELIYPASRYDIPVTGYWYEDEKKMIRGLLQQYLEYNTYDQVVTHVPQAIQDFVDDIVKNSINTCVGTPTSKESLNKLSDILKKITNPYRIVKKPDRIYENMKALASYQFGRKIAENLLKGCKIKGIYPYLKIMDNDIQLGMLVKERGFISLTIEGAKRIAVSGKYHVEIYDDFILKGSVFAPGVKDADESIRIGDEVIVVKNQEICGVGVAQMNGLEMKEIQHGEAVKIRHLN